MSGSKAELITRVDTAFRDELTKRSHRDIQKRAERLRVGGEYGIRGEETRVSIRKEAVAALLTKGYEQRRKKNPALGVNARRNVRKR